MRSERACCRINENHRRQRATYVPSATCWDSLECISDRCSTSLCASSFMKPCTSEPASPHVDIARGRREYLPGISSTRLRWRAVFSRSELAQGLTIAMLIRSNLFLRRGCLSKNAPGVVMIPLCGGFNVLFLSAGSLSEGSCVLNKLYFVIAKGSSQCLE